MPPARLRLAFMGSPAFAVPSLRVLHEAHDIVAVYCQPPRAAGRGQSPRRCAVHEAAEALNLPVRTPLSLRRDEPGQAAFAALGLDAAVVAAYGLILPQAMLDAPRRGCLNIHASLLPRWRGAAPLQAAILAGDPTSGITIMQMDAGLDTGPMLLAATVPLTATTTTEHLHDQLAALAPDLILRALQNPPAPQPQPDGATYAPKLTRDDSPLDWSQPAEVLARRVRALNPWPGTTTRLDGATLKIRAALPVDGSGAPGTVLDDALTVACGRGALRPSIVQAPNRAAMDVAAFLRGHKVPPGTRLG